MKSLKKQRRIQIIALATVALIGSTALIGYAMRDGINYFRSPSQVMETPPEPTETFRIGGLVEEGSLQRGQGEAVLFSVTDGGASVPVTFTGVLPDLFEENQGMVGTGRVVKPKACREKISSRPHGRHPVPSGHPRLLWACKFHHVWQGFQRLQRHR